MDGIPYISTAADLELRAAKIADPAIPLKVKNDNALELRDMVDTVRDAEVMRTFPQLLSVLIETLRAHGPSLKKDTMEYQYRRAIVETIHRIPVSEAMRSYSNSFIACVINTITQDSEENAVSILRSLHDFVRVVKQIDDGPALELYKTFMQLLRNVPTLIQLYLSEDSASIDPNAVVPSTQSFRAMAEIPYAISALVQSNRTAAQPVHTELLTTALDVVSIESPIQKKAREDYEAMGGNWAGEAPNMRNHRHYDDFIYLQSKASLSLVVMVRQLPEGAPKDPRIESIPSYLTRIYQDCPLYSFNSRKELVQTLRYIVSFPLRRFLVPYVDKIATDKFMSASLATSERHGPQTIVVDICSHLKTELSPDQLIRYTNLLCNWILTAPTTFGSQIYMIKTIYGVVEQAVQKVQKEQAVSLCQTVSATCAEKIKALDLLYPIVSARAEKRSSEETSPTAKIDISTIEKDRPFSSAYYATDNTEVLLTEFRYLFKLLMQGVRVCNVHVRRFGGGNYFDGELAIPWFESCLRILTHIDIVDTKDEKELIETFATTLMELELHVFQELWSQKLAFFLDHVVKRTTLLHLMQSLFMNKPTSQTAVSATLQHLSDRLDELGEMDDISAGMILRVYKLTFTVVSFHADINEPILASHLGRLIMDSFPLAAKSTHPTYYFHLMRALFRAIGSGGGRYEQLYKEVLPLLPEMLDCLNRQLNAAASDPLTRDLLVELCLTVPLRLTHLLPHLHYLMKPLVLALQGGTELVSQGLRTLELCIDNLIGDFLDPILKPVLRDLMEALHSHLKPLPGNHHHAHTTIRILGKLGGRNRRLLDEKPNLVFKAYSEPAKLTVSFSGRQSHVDISHVGELSARLLSKRNSVDKVHAYNYLEHTLTNMMNDGVQGKDCEKFFVIAVESLFDAIHIPEVQERAEEYLRTLSRHIFTLEARRTLAKDVSLRRYPSHLFSLYLDAFPHGLARADQKQLKKAAEIMRSIVHDFVPISYTIGLGHQETLPILHMIATRFSTMCFEDAWIRKSAGSTGIMIMTSTPDIGERWIMSREVDIVRTLLHVLKDSPHDPPRNVQEVIDNLVRVLRLTHATIRAQVDIEGTNSHYQARVPFLISIFFSEILSANPVVRQTSRLCIKLLSELSGKPVVELLLPFRERVMSSIYLKPLRSLPHPLIVGQVEAVRYCISTTPPLLELTEELMRLLHEALALADNSDGTLVAKTDTRKSTMEVVQLRVACLKLLTAAMPITDGFSRVPATRQRVTGVFFKSLYNSAKEVADAAHEGLRIILVDQSRFPKELLQTGLRPILMNLSDTKKLTIQDLEGLSRVLVLLANYFKVEIGSKLLDHFRAIADPNMLQTAARTPLAQNDSISKLVRLVNIYSLLPPTAVMYLKDLVSVVAQTEAQLLCCSSSPFSEPLAKFLDRNPSEAVDFFLEHMDKYRFVRTLRNLLPDDHASKLRRELLARSRDIANSCFIDKESEAMTTGLALCMDLANLKPGWTRDNGVIDALLKMLSNEAEQNSEIVHDYKPMFDKQNLIVALLIRAMEESPRIDILFEVIVFYSTKFSSDRGVLSRFLYKHVALEGSLLFRRNILIRFLTWIDDTSISVTRKTNFIRYVLNPMILVHCMRPQDEGLLDRHMTERLSARLWRASDSLLTIADDAMKIEIMHLTTILVQRRPQLLDFAKKDVIKFAWGFIQSPDDRPIKQVAYLLASRFLESFESPAKFVMTAWTGLLKPSSLEANRALARQAQDVLSSVLQRLPSEPNFPHWAKTTRRLLAEESVQNANIFTIYQLITRQSELFYPYRSLFIPHIINSLQKIGLVPAQAFPDGKGLCLDILQILYKWEMRSLQENGEEEDSTGWVTPIGFREGVVSYLTRVASAPPEPRSNAAAKALALMKDFLALSGWDDVAFKLDYFRKTLCEMEFEKENMPIIIATAKVLNVVCADKPDNWFLQNAKILQKLLQKGLVADEVAIHEIFRPIVEKLLTLFPLPKEDEDNQSELAEFHTFVYNTISENLKTTTSLHATLLLLSAVVDVVPERLEPFAASTTRLLQKLVKEHVGASPTAPTPGMPIQENPNDPVVRTIISLLKICQNSSMLPLEQRRLHIGSLQILIDKSTSVTICQYLLDTARDLALNKRDPHPSMKEKASLLLKMSSFETRGPGIFNQYLELIYDIYTDTSLRRSDLTSKLEHAFLLGCRAQDTSLRERFIDLLDGSIPRSLTSRLTYILGVQSWEPLADTNWIYLALDLLLSSIDGDMPLASTNSSGFMQASSPLSQTLSSSRIRDVIRPMRRLLYYDTQLCHNTWVAVFSAVWSTLSRKEQGDVTQHMIVLLSKEYHIRQSEMRPNVIQALLEGIHSCSPPMSIPAHLLKYLAKTFGAWHVALEQLQCSLEYVRDDDSAVRDSVYDALAEVYAELVEEDMFYGLWRRRSLHHETNVAITYEQNGMWAEAQISYEKAQTRARGGSIPFTESEYCLWEDHWILATEKLQQWDVLYELSHNDGNTELLLESAWRFKDWTDKDTLQQMEEHIQKLSDVATPRRRVYEAFIALVKMPSAIEKNMEFTRILEDAMQLSLRKWIAFPPKMSACHIPLLQHFQQFVELQEAVQIFGSLSSTTAQNLEKKSAELKLVLQAWRERLPNLHDDISVWSDIVAWRTNVFNAINKQYLPIIQGNNASSSQNAANSTFGFRGYHEIAWIINRFAHVARKHDLFDVAQTMLTKIYELPNIEISEAFLKLREEARCRLQVPERMLDGLNLINNTNLMYFSTPQKSEFYTLKGMFYYALNQSDEADNNFRVAVQTDMNVAKAWAEWGRFSDKMFQANPSEYSYGKSAITCYLQAAGLYKNAKSRPLVTRILWLLGIDDAQSTIATAFNEYTGERALWYWITLIPQLLFSLSYREAPQAQRILQELIRAFPQAIFFPLRTAKEELHVIRKQLAQQQEAARRAAQAANANGANTSAADGAASMSVDATAPQNGTKREDWEIVEELASLLKSNNPLLALTLEAMVDQFNVKFKSTPEEEIYRFTFMLLQDAVQNYCSRAQLPNDDGTISEQIQKNIGRMAIHLTGAARTDYEADFIHSKPLLEDYIHRLQHWRDRYEKYLDSRPRVQPLDLLSHWLVEFQYTKFDEVEVPGQYHELVDGPQQFSRVKQFGPKFEICRGQGFCYKRIVIVGHDGVKFNFAVQQPAARWCRREERLTQLFRTFNHALTRRKESRKRNLQFHLPTAISLNPQVRLLSNDPSYVSLQDIYDQHCEEIGVTREDPALMIVQKHRAVMREVGSTPTTIGERIAIRKNVLDEVMKKMVGEDVLSKYIMRTMCGPQELWRMRKAFTLQLAAVSFMTYTVCVTSRQPGRYHISRSTGQLYTSESLPGINGQADLIQNDAVPFRFTPNLQHFVNPIGTEALFCPGIVAIARALTKPEYELDQHLCLFIRDEVLTHLMTRGTRDPQAENVFRAKVQKNIDSVVNRAETMACKLEKNQDPKDEKLTQNMQSVTNLISTATNPLKLASMPDLFAPWY